MNLDQFQCLVCTRVLDTGERGRGDREEMSICKDCLKQIRGIKEEK